LSPRLYKQKAAVLYLSKVPAKVTEAFQEQRLIADKQKRFVITLA